MLWPRRGHWCTRSPRGAALARWLCSLLFSAPHSRLSTRQAMWVTARLVLQQDLVSGMEQVASLSNLS